MGFVAARLVCCYRAPVAARETPRAEQGERRAASKHSTGGGAGGREARRAKKLPEGGPPRSGRVALVGRPNVGKSTLLNAALEQPLAIVSPTPQTTRDALLGVVHHGSAEIGLLDTPGIHRPRSELGRVMNRTAREAARGADVVVFVTDVPAPKTGAKRPTSAVRAPLTPHAGDLVLLSDIGGEAPVVLVVNKVDRMKDKTQLLPLLEALSRVRTFASVVPISALRSEGVTRVLDEVAKLCPEGAWRYGDDALTDRPVRFFAGEYVREQILRATKEEVPHVAAVSIDEFTEPTQGGTVRIAATIHVERQGQKRILIGVGGEMLKRIGTRARQRIEELTERHVHLELWVRVTPSWRESRQQLEELGYGSGGGERASEEAEDTDLGAEAAPLSERDALSERDEDDEANL